MTEIRPCTCHPDEAPVPCQRGYALSLCLRRELNDKSDEITRLKAEVARKDAALEKIGGIKGAYSAPWPERQEGYASFAVVTSRAALTPSQEPRT